MSATREQMLLLLRDMLALQTAAALNIIKLPTEAEIAPIKRDAASTADKLLDAFESELLISRVRSLIIRDVRKELMTRTRISRYVDWGIGISALLVAAVLAASAFLFTDPISLGGLKALYWVSVILATLIAAGFLFLKTLDPS